MVAELGHFALILALILAGVQATVPLWGAYRRRGALMRVGPAAAQGQFVFLLIAFACLTWVFVGGDFSVRLVMMHSHTDTPLIYRVTGVWGNHEGSLLLWALALSAWTLAVAMFGGHLAQVFLARVLAVLGWIATGFLSFALFTSNPFQRQFPPPAQGHDLNPLLQDPGMIIHPPLLYMGYVGFSVAFAFAVAALLSGRLDAAWARWSRPWTTAAWLFLTAGIAVGSGWAYYELGWGGWWFWDPVENASFMPWLLGTALIHSLAVTEKRSTFRNWTVLLAIATFSMSLLGTFLVRSGVITSVHAFATDPARGVFILVFLAVVIGASLLLFALRAPTLRHAGSLTPVSRETVLLCNYVLLLAAAGSVMVGTLYPLFLDALGLGKISVGPPYFEATFPPLMVPVVALMVIGPFVRWKRDRVARLWRGLTLTAVAAAGLGIGAMVFIDDGGMRSALWLTLAAWVILGSFALLGQRAGERKARMAARLRGISVGWWGMWLAHLGVGVFIIGVTLVSTLETQLDVRMAPGEHAELAGYGFTLRRLEAVEGPNYSAVRGVIDVRRGERRIATLTPEKRVYVGQQMPMTEASIDTGLFRDLYVALGEPVGGGAWIVSLYHKPFISWIWMGCVLMGLGGVFAAADRRYRRLADRTNLGQGLQRMGWGLR